MKLNEQIHHSIETLDNESLSLIYEQVRALQKKQSARNVPPSAPSLEEVLELTSSIPGDCSDDVCAEREERL